MTPTLVSSGPGAPAGSVTESGADPTHFLEQKRQLLEGSWGAEALDPGPAALDLGLQVRHRTAVVHHEVGLRQPVLAARLVGHAGPGVVGVEVAELHQPFDRDVGIDIDDDDAGDAVPARLGQQRDVQDHRVIGLGLRRHPSEQLVAYPRVHDLAQRLQLVGIDENHIGHGLAIQRPVGVQDPVPQQLDHLGEHDLAGRLQFPHDGIGVDDDRAPRRARRTRWTFLIRSPQ